MLTKYFSNKKINYQGFSLIETLVGVVVFAIIAISIYQTYAAVIESAHAVRVNIAATSLANEQFEIIRNLPYADVGILSGIPSGKIPHSQTLVRDNITFNVETTIRNIDDSFDGLVDGEPDDTSPADYKLVALEITCSNCKKVSPLYFTTQVSSRGLETASTNGALFVQVFDAVGQPVQDADIHIVNNQAIPQLVIDDNTDNQGMLKIIDVPPGVEAYEISVSKNGYSSDRTYLTGDLANPNPIKPHSTVALQQLTQISFVIDLNSTLNISSVTEICAPVINVDFSFSGTKIIGTPNVLKYNNILATDAAGKANLYNLEWDTYNLLLTDSAYDLIGTIPLLPLVLNPNSNQDLKLILAPKNLKSFLVTVKDTSTGLSLTGADVRLEKTPYDNTLTTGQGFLRQIDWSGGDGQDNYIDSSKYFSDDGNISIDSPAGELRLVSSLGQHQSSGYIISSSFDTGSPSNFHQLIWQPQDQPPETGAESVKFKLATNNDNSTWNFLGPDGTADTFYTLGNTIINAIHNNDRYLRYQVFLETMDSAYTPNLAEIAITFTSSCVPPGQVFFTGLESGDYNLTVVKDGYQSFSDSINISAPWQQREVLLAP